MDEREPLTSSGHVAGMYGADFVGSYPSTETTGVRSIGQTNEWGRNS